MLTAPKYPTTLWELGQHINQQNLEDLVREFLFYQANPQESSLPPVNSIRWLTVGISKRGKSVIPLLSHG